jgi:hypothetical protein
MSSKHSSSNLIKIVLMANMTILNPRSVLLMEMLYLLPLYSLAASLWNLLQESINKWLPLKAIWLTRPTVS